MPATPPEVLIVGVIAAVSALAAGLAGCAPTGMERTDVVFTALLAAVVVAVGSRASGLALCVTALVVIVAGQIATMWVLGAVALIAAYSVARDDTRRRSRRARSGDPTSEDTERKLRTLMTAAFSAAVAVQALLRLPMEDPARASALVAVLALAPLLWSGWRRLAPVGHRTGRFVLVGLVLFGTIGAVTGAVVGWQGGRSLERGADGVDEGLAAGRDGDQDAAVVALRGAADSMADTRDLTRSWWALPARHLPLVAQQTATFDLIADSGHTAATDAADSAAALDGDNLRLVDGRLDPTVVDEARPVLVDLARRTERTRSRLAQPGHRNVWQLPTVADGLESLTDAVTEAEGSARTGALAAEVGPSLLGAEGEARYFVAFVSPSEARATGFVGNYGILTVTDGRIELTEVGRNDDLNAGGGADKEISGPSDYLERYRRFEPASTWQNVTFTPDGPTAGMVMAELYAQSGGEPVDGVIRIDPTGLSRLLRLTGPVEVDGLPYALDSQNVVSFLQVEQYRLFEVADERSDLLGQAAEGVFRALTSGEGPAPSRMAGTLGPAVEGGHLSIWLRNARAQQLVDHLGASGAVDPIDSDGFGITTQNAGGSKIDVFLQREIDYVAEVNPNDGAVEATATIRLHNDAPRSGEPDYLIGNLIDAPDGTNRSWVSVYSPHDLVRLSVDGQEIQADGQRELDRNVWSFFLDIPAGGTAEVVVELRGSVDLSLGGYRFDVMSQVMANPDHLSVEVTIPGAQLEAAPVEREAPGGTSVGGARLHADSGDAQGPWAVAVSVMREP